MSFFRFGNFDIPQENVKFDGIRPKPNQRQDLDSYTDAFGVTQRNALAHTKTEIVFTTLDMDEQEFRVIMDGIVRNYRNPNERDAMCTYWDDEYGVFKTGHFYLDPSFAPNVREKNPDGSTKSYSPTTWTFIEY